VVKEGALADRLLVDGNPLEDIDRVADPENSLIYDREGWNGLQEHVLTIKLLETA
jgi:hypothetical protein